MSSINGKTNEKPWSIRHGKEATANQNKRDKKERPHYIYDKKKVWNKKRKKFELVKTKEIISTRCS